MYDKTSSLRKLLVTDITLVLFIFIMDSLVPDKATSQCKMIATQITFKWSLLVMSSPHV